MEPSWVEWASFLLGTGVVCSVSGPLHWRAPLWDVGHHCDLVCVGFVLYGVLFCGGVTQLEDLIDLKVVNFAHHRRS